jgi:hypothetical protein
MAKKTGLSQDEAQPTRKDEAQPTRKYARYNVSAEDFIRTWQTSESAEEVAEKLKMPVAIVHARASSYRSVGVKLKRMKRKAGLDVAGLNALIEALAAGKVKPKEREEEK